MGNVQSFDDEQSIEQSCVCAIRREKSSSLASRYQRVVDDLLLSERRYVADMQVCPRSI